MLKVVARLLLMIQIFQLEYEYIHTAILFTSTTRKIHFSYQQKVRAIKKKPLVMMNSTQVGHKNKFQILLPQWRPLTHTKNY